ncbi:MAG: PH domain-containing protein [Chloroflexota bacterium]|nr:PH domain-containing protein [Chloroflexota bacterium]
MTARIWTFGYALTFLYFAFRIATMREYDLYNFGVVVASLVILIFAYVRSVRGYLVGDGNLVVVRSGPGRVQIPLSNVIRVQNQPDMGAFYNPTFLSIGGVFGWAGRVQVRKPLDVRSVQATAYGTNARNSVFLTLNDDRLLILTPVDPAAFVLAIQQAGVGPASASSNKSAATAARRPSRRK